MKISKSILYLTVIFLIQWVIMIIIPYFFFKYIAEASIYPGDIYLDQFIKALIAFILISVWLLEWMWLGTYFYKHVRKR